MLKYIKYQNGFEKAINTASAHYRGFFLGNRMDNANLDILQSYTNSTILCFVIIPVNFCYSTRLYSRNAHPKSHPSATYLRQNRNQVMKVILMLRTEG